MRFLRHTVLALVSAALSCLAPLAASAQTNYTTNVTLNNLLSTGGAVTSAKVCASAVDQYGNPLAFSSPTWGLVEPGAQFCGTASGGAIAGGFNVPDACHTNQPSPIFYNVTIQPLASGVPTGGMIQLNRAPIPSVCGTAYPLDSYTPSTTVISPQSQIVTTGNSVPSSCTSPSLFLITVGGVTTGYVCSNGVPTAFGQTGVAIAGDLGGTSGSPKVVGLQGVPVAATAPSYGQSLQYNGSQYVPATPASGSGAATSANVYSANAQTQVDSVTSSVYYGLDCFGDSYMAGLGASQTTGQCGIVAADYNMPAPNNFAVSGDNAGDLAWHIFTSLNPSDSGNPMVIAAASQNNTNCGVTSTCLQMFNQTYYAAFAWGALSSTKKIIFSGNYATVKTGTYTTDTTFANANGLNCTSGPCTYSTRFIVGQPGYVYLWYIMGATGGTLSATIDGTTATDTVTGLTSISTAWGFAPNVQTKTVGLARFAASSASPGTHTIVVTASSGAVVIGLGLPTVSRYRGVTAPRIVMGGTHQKPGASGTATTAYNNASIAVQQTLVSDGLDVPFADLYNAYNLNLDFASIYDTISQSGTTMTISATTSTYPITLGQAVYVAGASIGVVTAFGTGTGGVGTYTLSNSATIASTTAFISTQGCLSASNLQHPSDCGHIDAAHAWEANLNAAPIPIQGSPSGPSIIPGPIQTNGGICLYNNTLHCIAPTSGNTDTFNSSGAIAPSFMSTGTPLPASAGQVSQGGTTVAASFCNQGGTLTSVAGCVVINVAGTNHYYPYF